MVNLTHIYTRTGDGGETRLSDNSLTRKTDLRVEAYGSVDEANCVIGVALAMDEVDDRLRSVLTLVQNELFDVGADLATPVVADPPWEPLRIEQAAIDRLEHWIDEFGEELPNLQSFILPGGTKLGAQLHLARTVTRRAERAAWAALEAYVAKNDSTEQTGGFNPIAVKYLNRLSDLLFSLSRYANLAGAKETLWVPGGQRNPHPEKFV